MLMTNVPTPAAIGIGLLVPSSVSFSVPGAATLKPFGSALQARATATAFFGSRDVPVIVMMFPACVALTLPASMVNEAVGNAAPGSGTWSTSLCGWLPVTSLAVITHGLVELSGGTFAGRLALSRASENVATPLGRLTA